MSEHEHEWGAWEEGKLGEPYGNPFWFVRCSCGAGRVRWSKP